MPRPGRAEINTEPCDVCGKVIRYKADVPRHKRTHNKEAPTYRCPFEGCKYRNLQKSNVKTHIRTHTGEKPLSCPECDFRTSDPGSLTRHRKRLHDYVPKKAGHTGRVPALKRAAKRHAPYGHSPRFSASSPSPVASKSSLTSDRFLNLAILEKQVAAAYATLQSIYGPSVSVVPSQNTLSFPWDKDFEVVSNKCPSPLPACKAELDSLSYLCPPELVAAGHAGPQIEGFGGVSKTIAANPAPFNTFLPSAVKSSTSAALPTTLASISSTAVPASQPVYPSAAVQQQSATGTEAFWNRDYSVLTPSPALTSSALTSSSSDSDFFTEPLSISPSFSSPFSSSLFSFSDLQVPEVFVPSVKTGFEASEMHNLFCSTSPLANFSDVFAYC